MFYTVVPLFTCFGILLLYETPERPLHLSHAALNLLATSVFIVIVLIFHTQMLFSFDKKRFYLPTNEYYFSLVIT